MRCVCAWWWTGHLCRVCSLPLSYVRLDRSLSIQRYGEKTCHICYHCASLWSCSVEIFWYVAASDFPKQLDSQDHAWSLKPGISIFSGLTWSIFEWTAQELLALNSKAASAVVLRAIVVDWKKIKDRRFLLSLALLLLQCLAALFSDVPGAARERAHL